MASQISATPLQVIDLPNEILTHIFHCLDNPPPSYLKALSKPEHDLTFSKRQPLKSVSLTQSHLRFLILPLLFRHARVDPYHLSSFMDFVTTSDIARHVESITARLQGPCSHIHPAWWSRVCDDMPNLKTLTVLAAPHVFAEIGQVPIDTSHSWAFKIPYQTMTLSQTTQLSHHSTVSNLECDKSCIDAAKQSLLDSKSWTSLAINESSHLSAYSTYEYFLKIPPSLLTSLYRQQPEQARPRYPPLRSFDHCLSPSSASFFNNISNFSYTAIFPFYNHVDEILKCIRQMKQLKKLFLKLCPEPDSTVLQDELERNGGSAGRTEGRIDVNDPWNEFETSYALIPHTIIYLTTDGCLEEFQTDDVKMVGVRDSLIEGIDRRLEGLGCWVHDGEGTWKRDMKVAMCSEDEGNRAGSNEGSHSEGGTGEATV